MGFQQCAHLTRLAFLVPVVRAGEACIELWHKNDANTQDAMSYFYLCSLIGRRCVMDMLAFHAQTFQHLQRLLMPAISCRGGVSLRLAPRKPVASAWRHAGEHQQV